MTQCMQHCMEIHSRSGIRHSEILQASRLPGATFHQPSFSKAALEYQAAFPVDTNCVRATEFSFPNRWRARSPTLQHLKYYVQHGLQHPRGPGIGSDGSTGHRTGPGQAGYLRRRVPWRYRRNRRHLRCRDGGRGFSEAEVSQLGALCSKTLGATQDDRRLDYGRKTRSRRIGPIIDIAIGSVDPLAIKIPGYQRNWALVPHPLRTGVYLLEGSHPQWLTSLTARLEST